MDKSAYDFSATKNDGSEISLKEFAGQVLLIVNTASKCGFTYQYEGLEKLYQQYSSHGFSVLAFPCDQFGHQEPGNDEEIKQFCNLNYSITFPLFKKIEVNGDNTHPLFEYLKSEARGLLASKRIKWNFTKFLVNREGKVVRRFSPAFKPESLTTEIKRYINGAS
ncbi:glutathione peroxidase [Alteromonas sp. ASW11-130]|uniref:glutathione peroxidase n=1 Tax=Alteromonas sp. ASW11-130 TaxID=3015775 RepID=UPI002241FB16|nr:glutathione peroxidase [Alteromonas sp. ASW11-130]MCW8092211.1 glutathione peroxidase [Alteromonas sp. ASW11-130]